MNEVPFVTVPIDYELTSDASRVVVRGLKQSAPFDNTDAITVWETAGGTKVVGSTPTGFCSAAQLSQASSTPSDAVRVVGSKAVLIGNDSSGQRTLIDVVDAGAATPACLANFALPSVVTGASDEAGEAHDLDITPDGKYAVVNCRNWLFVVDLSVTPPSLVTALNTGSPTILPSWAVPPSDVGAAVDSVAATNFRAIVVQGAFTDLGLFRPIVYLVSFASDPPQVTQIDMQPIISGLGLPQVDPHDVAITTDQDDLAVVTYDFAVSLFDLTALSHVETIADDPPGSTETTRRYGRQVDSVELNSDHAVVIGWKQNSATWSVKDFSLRASSSVPDLALVQAFSGAPGSNLSPHDLDLHRDVTTDAAVIKIGDGVASANLVLKSVSSAPVLHTLGSSGTPYADWVSFPNSGPTSRVSDSVMAVTLRDVNAQLRRFGVSIGGSVGPQISGAIDVIDLQPSTPVLLASLSAGSATFGTMPTDLAFSALRKRIFVRCEAPPDEPPPATTGRDVLVGRLDTLPIPTLEVGVNPQIGGQGRIRLQVDSMIVNRLRAVSVAQKSDQSEGYVHTSTNP